MSATRYPLSWPAGWKRTPAHQRYRAKFSKKGSSGWRDKLSIEQATQRVRAELQRMGIYEGNVIISTNLVLRNDGLPRSGQQEPQDSGAAVYWKRQAWKTHKVMAIDQYDRVADNLAAIAATLDAMRAIERHGGATILDRAFEGFTALPEPNNWRHVLQMPSDVPAHKTVAEFAREQYKQLALMHHPDRGGDPAKMAEINAAWEAAQRELNG